MEEQLTHDQLAGAMIKNQVLLEAQAYGRSYTPGCGQPTISYNHSHA